MIEIRTVSPTGTRWEPEVMESEYGGVFWIVGHVDRFQAVLAVTVEEMVNVGGPEARMLLVGHDDRTLSWAEGLGAVNDLLDSVTHVWFLPDPDDEEKMDQVKRGTPGALPFTKVVTPW